MVTPSRWCAADHAAMALAVRMVCIRKMMPDYCCRPGGTDIGCSAEIQPTDLVLGRESREELRNRLLECGMDQRRVNLNQWLQHEAAQMQAGMRHGQFLF